MSEGRVTCSNCGGLGGGGPGKRGKKMITRRKKNYAQRGEEHFHVGALGEERKALTGE